MANIVTLRRLLRLLSLRVGDSIVLFCAQNVFVEACLSVVLQLIGRVDSTNLHADILTSVSGRAAKISKK